MISLKNKTSVVIATYNGEKYILEELNSIKNQTIPPDEVIISDDCSSDQTCEIIENFIEQNKLQHWKLIKNEKNKGFSMNFLEAMYLSNGDYIFLADQDDVWVENKVERFLYFFETLSDSKSIGSELKFIDKYSKEVGKPTKVPNVSFVYDKKVIAVDNSDNIISSFMRGCTMCISRDTIDFIKKYDLAQYCSNYLLGHDWLIWTIASLLGNCYLYRDALILYRIHDTNSSLGARQRKQLIGELEKRIEGLQKSIAIHCFIMENSQLFKNYSNGFDLKIKKCIRFEKRRLRFLKNGSMIQYIRLLFSIHLYKRYYRSFLKGVKVYLGDLLYFLNGKKGTD